jgi:hypothetical protein
MLPVDCVGNKSRQSVPCRKRKYKKLYHTLKINIMDTLPHSDESEESASDRLYRAYDQKVKELLSQSDAETWIEDLWDMYTGFTLFSQEAGYDPRGHDRFVSFKELVFFFRDIGQLKL